MSGIKRSQLGLDQIQFIIRDDRKAIGNERNDIEPPPVRIQLRVIGALGEHRLGTKTHRQRGSEERGKAPRTADLGDDGER